MIVLTDCTSCERMTKAEVEINGLKRQVDGMQEKLDTLIVEVAKSRITSVILNIVSPVTIGLIVYVLTK